MILPHEPRPSYLERPFWDYNDARPFDDVGQVLEEVEQTAVEAYAARQDALDTEARGWLQVLEAERIREAGL